MKTRQQGMSLIEVLIAVTILLIGIVPMIRVMMYGLYQGNRANKMSIATYLSRELAEEIRSKAFSEEFTPSFSGNRDPETMSTGLEETSWTGKRMSTFDDVDDYDGWCDGEASGCRALQNFDGDTYDDPTYRGFTRRVDVFNIFPVAERITKNPFANVSSMASTKVDRFNLEETNFPNLTTDEDGNHARGRTGIKVIRVNVSYQGTGTGDLEVNEVSFSVSPLR